MQMLRAALILIAGAASVAAVVAVGPRAESERDDAGLGGGAAGAPAKVNPQNGETADLRMVVLARPPPGAVTGNVRNVTPEGVTAAPVVSAPLVRVEPPPEPARPPEPRTERLFNPLVTAAGILKVREREIRLAGIAAPDFHRRCGEGLGAWPCGRMARAALRSFIRGRAVECDVPAGAEAIPDPAECRVAGRSLSEWLVAQGWAESDGDGFTALEQSARAEKLGMWSGDRPGGQPDEAAASSSPASLRVDGSEAPESAAPIRARVSSIP
jgi:endonuclease YncB( thermonuclease family)